MEVEKSLTNTLQLNQNKQTKEPRALRPGGRFVNISLKPFNRRRVVTCKLLEKRALLVVILYLRNLLTGVVEKSLFGMLN